MMSLSAAGWVNRVNNLLGLGDEDGVMGFNIMDSGKDKQVFFSFISRSKVVRFLLERASQGNVCD